MNRALDIAESVLLTVLVLAAVGIFWISVIRLATAHS